MDSALYGQLRVFHAIAAERSITGAARRLGVGLPAVSKALKALETTMQVPLFSRTTRRLEITEAGQRLLAQTGAAMLSLEAAVEEVRDLGQRPRGPVRITTARFAYLCLLRPRLAALCEAFPEIELEVSLHEGTIDIIRDGYDLGIRFGDRLEEGMIARRLMAPFREGLFVSRDYARRHGLPQGPADLGRHRLIGYRFTTSNRLLPLTLEAGGEAGGDAVGEAVTVQMPAGLVTNDTLVIADAVRAGLGIGRIFEPVHAGLPFRDELVPVLEPQWRRYPGVYLYFAQQGGRTARVRAVIDFLTGRAG